MLYSILFTGELIYPYNNAHWRYQQQDMLDVMNGWCEYELRELDDAGRRAEVCGVPIEEVREGVLAIMLKEDLSISQAKAQSNIIKPWMPMAFVSTYSGGRGHS
mgnify:CR=1 FL=1